MRIRSSIHHKRSEKSSLWPNLLGLFSLSGCHLFDKSTIFFFSGLQPQQEWKVQILDFPVGLGLCDSLLMMPTSTGQASGRGHICLACGELLGWRYVQTDHHVHHLTCWRMDIWCNSPSLFSTKLCTVYRYGMPVQALLPGFIMIGVLVSTEEGCGQISGHPMFLDSNPIRSSWYWYMK